MRRSGTFRSGRCGRRHGKRLLRAKGRASLRWTCESRLTAAAAHPWQGARWGAMAPTAVRTTLNGAFGMPIASLSPSTMADQENTPPSRSPSEDAYPHIYVKDTDAQFPTTQTTGFGRYSDFQPLAQGGSAILRTCRDKNLGRTVVMKTLHPHLATNEYMHARFLREARVTAQLQHPTSVPVYDLGRDLEGRLYFTMKKVEGINVRDVIERQLAGDAAATGRLRSREDARRDSSNCERPGLRPCPRRGASRREAREHPRRRLRRGGAAGLGRGQGMERRLARTNGWSTRC